MFGKLSHSTVIVSPLLDEINNGFTKRTTGPPAVEFLSSIGVKPLDAIGGDSAAAMVSAGISEEVSAQLSKIKGLKVISRTTMEAVNAKGWTTRTVADSLGIRYLIEGSVQRSGARSWPSRCS